jgi:hypothetical protein
MVAWEVDNGEWQAPLPITHTGFAEPGGHLAVAHQPPNDQLTAVLVDPRGAMRVLWEVDNGSWHEGTITPGGFALPGSPVAAIVQPPNDQLDVFVVGADGRLYVLWEVNNGPWQGPAAISQPVFDPGAEVEAVRWRGGLRVYGIMKSGHLLEASVTGSGSWTAQQVL